MADDKSKPEETVEEVKEEATETEQPKDEKEEKTTAKAGKRSAKAQKEAEEKAAKEERKAKGDAENDTPEEVSSEVKKGPRPIARPKLERRSKRYQEAQKGIDKEQTYSLQEGVKLAVKASTVKFDASVELHVRLNVDPKQADQNIRSHLVLPHGIGKEARVAVFVPSDKVEAAKKAGADIVGEDAVNDLLSKEQLDFDILIATPQSMAQLGKYAKVLGPKGLMPNPKSGTVTNDVEQAIKEAKAGRIEYRVDSEGIVHQNIGKVSFGDAKIAENAQAFVNSVKSARPASVKGNYIESAFLTTSMGPSVRINVQ